MNIFLEAAEFVDREATRAAGLAKVATALQEAGSLVQVVAETEAKINERKRDLAEVEQLHTEAAGQLAKAVAQTETTLAALGKERDAADDYARRVRADADAYVADRRLLAQDIITEAKSKAEADTAERVERAMADVQAKTDELGRKAAGDAIAAARSVLTALEAETAAAQSRRDAITRQIAELKARL